MPHAAKSHAHTAHPLRRALFLGITYLLALVLLILWESRERLQLFESPCQPAVSESKSPFYSEPYRRILNWASSDTSSFVSTIAIPRSLEQIQQNICLSRAYTADILRLIAAQHPAEVVLDRFYSPNSCASDPQSTTELISVVRSLPFPVIVGESTEFAAEEHDNACLVRRSQLDFASPNVRHGLIRLNIEPERIPLLWRVLPAANPESKPSEIADSLSWAAVRAYDPDFAASNKLQALLRSDRHPYANLQARLPSQTTTQLLCSAGTPEMRARWSPDCTGLSPGPRLLGKVVLIGAESNNDRFITLGRSRWGYELQASYIEAILSSSFLRALPFWASFFLFIVYVVLIEGLPVLLKAFFPRWRRKLILRDAYGHHCVRWILECTVLFLAFTTAFSLFLRYLPPLPVLGDMLFVAVTRLLIMAAESTETPFVHHVKRKAPHGVIHS